MKAWAALAAAVVATSWASILIRYAEAPPLVVSFYRMGISAAILLPFLFLGSRRGWLREPRALGTALGAGALLGLHFACWITSLAMTSIASSVVLVATAPVFAALLSSGFLGERAGRVSWSGIALAVAGSALIAWGDSSPSAAPGHAAPLVGDVLALAGALFGAAYLTLGRRVRERVPLPGYLAVVYASGAAVAGLGAALQGDPLTGYTARVWMLFAAIAIVPNLIGHSLLNWGVRRMRTYVVGVAILGEPILATLYAAVLFGEVPGLQWAGGAALIGAGLVTLVLAESATQRVEVASASHD